MKSFNFCSFFGSKHTTTFIAHVLFFLAFFFSLKYNAQ